jgi:hypothetical protein
VYILIISQEPIWDPKKDPLLEELKAVYIRGIGLYEELARLEQEAKCVKSDDPEVFTTILINPKILVIEHKFKLTQRKGISQIIVADEDSGDLDKESSSEGSSVGDNDIILLPSRLVASIDLI